VQGAADFHHQITNPLLPQADAVLHDAAALDTAVDMLDPQPAVVQRLVRALLLPRVAYLLLADNISGPLSIRLRRANQPVIRTRNAFSTFLPSLLADI